MLQKAFKKLMFVILFLAPHRAAESSSATLQMADLDSNLVSPFKKMYLRCKETENVCVHSPNAHSVWGWTKTKARNQEPNPSLPCKWWELSLLNHHYCLLASALAQSYYQELEVGFHSFTWY